MKCKVYARAEVHPTEDLDKVIRALSNLFAYDDIEIGRDYVCVSGDVETLLDFRESLTKRKIRGTARKMMMRGVSDNKILFYLNKQAALVGIPNFVDEELSALGEIEVTVKTDDVEEFMDWMAPVIDKDINNDG